MFTVKPVTTIKEKIIIQEPKGLGRTKPCDITVEFKKLSVTEAKQLLEDASNGEMNDDQSLEDNIIDIAGLLDESGAKIEYSKEILPELLEMEYVRRPMIEKFMEVIIGKKALKAKN